MRITVLALAALVATGCMGRGASVGKITRISATSLEISISAAGTDGPTKLWTLSCPGGGTLPRPTRACSRLEAVDKPFAPVPRNVACTAIYGGPQVADVRGRFHGRAVNAHFTRTDGCQINRWNKVRFLFPGT